MKRNIFWKIISLAIVALTPQLALAHPVDTVSLQPLGASQEALSVEQAVADAGSARVVVALWPPPAAASADVHRVQVLQAQDRVLEALPAGDFQLLHRYRAIPGLVGLVDDQGLDALRDHPDVRAVALDMPVQAFLDESVALIGADRVWEDLGLSGAGVNVALLDSGIDLDHPDLADHVVAQHCFNRGACPPDRTDEGEDARDEQGHGTHVAGILTGRGIAPDAGIVAVRVLDGTGSGWTSDVVAGIEWVVANRDRLDVRVINLSLGAGHYSGECDTADANTMLYASAVHAARDAGITVLAASGNSARSAEMAAPACLSGVLSVGATYDADLGPLSWSVCNDTGTAVDQIACFSNSSPALDLLAPGALITSSALGGGRTSKAGTSMAAPHAAAVVALMLEAAPGLTPDEIERILTQTGVSITDDRNGQVTPRVDALAAVSHLSPHPVTATLRLVPSDVSLTVGATATTTLQVTPTDFYTLAFSLTFAPDIVGVVDADPASPGVQVGVGELFEGAGATVVQNQVEEGVVTFRAACSPGAVEVGPGEVAVITWQGVGAGRSELALTQVELASADGHPISYTVASGAAKVVSTTGTVSGTVLLQGTTVHSGTRIYAGAAPCSPKVSGTTPLAVTDAYGHFEMPAGDYQCLYAVHERYLTGQADQPQGDLGTLTLPGGDLIRDDVIDILDLTFVAGRFGGQDPAADLNRDGLVDIFDLTLAAGNYGRRGPVNDWQ